MLTCISAINKLKVYYQHSGFQHSKDLKHYIKLYKFTSQEQYERKMDAKQFLEEVSLDTTVWTSTASDTLKTTFDISPQDFIKYAETDLTSDYEHNIINALSNSKRALDCQLDTLLLAFGFYKISQLEFWSFPKKIGLISELGVIAPRVLHKINKQRNLLEHQFIKPQKESVEDFLDIALLFIASTDKYSLKFITSLHFRNDDLKKFFTVRNQYAMESFNLIIRHDKTREGNTEAPIELSIDSKNQFYKPILKQYLKSY
jgi:hypothetical protein